MAKLRPMSEQQRVVVIGDDPIGSRPGASAHEESGETVADPVDDLRTEPDMLVGVPREVERVCQPVHAVEDQIDMQGVDDCLVGHARAAHRIDIGAVEPIRGPGDLLQQGKDRSELRSNGLCVVYVDLAAGFDARDLCVNAEAERAFVKPRRKDGEELALGWGPI